MKLTQKVYFIFKTWPLWQNRVMLGRLKLSNETKTTWVVLKCTQIVPNTNDGGKYEWLYHCKPHGTVFQLVPNEYGEKWRTADWMHKRSFTWVFYNWMYVWRKCFSASVKVFWVFYWKRRTKTRQFRRWFGNTAIYMPFLS